MRPLRLLLAPLALSLAYPAAATEPPNPQIDYPGYVELTASLEGVREEHRLPLDQFLARARRDGAILLDARSESAFAAGHIEGAVNLPLPDFTDEALAAVLGPDKDRPIYIYCNNNFSDDRPPIATKRAPLSLNIATFHQPARIRIHQRVGARRGDRDGRGGVGRSPRRLTNQKGRPVSGPPFSPPRLR